MENLAQYIAALENASKALNELDKVMPEDYLYEVMGQTAGSITDALANLVENLKSK